MSIARPELQLGKLAGRRSAAIGLIGASAIACAAAYIANAGPAGQPWPALIAWAAGIGLLLAGAWLLAMPAASSAGASRVAGWEIAAVVAITLVAAGLRIAALDGIPHNFGGDEGEMGHMARAVISGEVRDPFATGWLSHPTLWFFLQALSLRVFGDSIFGLRMLSALIGVATIPMLYAFARPFYTRWVALGAAGLLAVYHFHIHFSRLALNNIVDPFSALLAFGAFLHGYRTRSPFSFALAGITLGVAQHFYMGARLAPLVIAALLLHQALLDRHKLVSLRWQLLLLAAGFLIGIGPLLAFFIKHPSDFNARLALVSIFQTGWFDQQRAAGLSTLQIMAGQARGAFGAWTAQPERSAFYDPQMPLLDRGSAILFLAGLVATAARWRRIDSALLLAWLLGVAVFGGMLLVNAPESPRYVTSAPAICLLMAAGGAELLALLRRAMPIDWRVVYGMGAAGMLLLALWNINFYFREYTPRNSYGWSNTEIGTAAGRYLAQQPDPVFVYFFGAGAMFYNNPSIHFQAPNVAGIDVAAGTPASALPPPPAGYRPIFMFLAQPSAELAAIERRYPNGATQAIVASSGNTTLLTIYAAPR